MKKEDVYYVGVTEPVEIRRNVLEAAKEILESMHRFEKFKAVRIEKGKTVKVLRDQIDDITKMIAKLKSSLPKSEGRIKVGQVAQKVEKKAAKKSALKKEDKKEVKVEEEQKLKLTERETTELEKLEAELADIEGKLSQIG